MEDYFEKERKRKEKEATSKKHLKKGLNRRERLDTYEIKRGFNGR